MNNTISFPKMFNKNKFSLSTSLSYNKTSINESLKSLFMSSPGELLGDPSWGSNLKEMLFSLKTQPNTIIIKQMIVSAIERYEPRIKTDINNIKIYSSKDSTHYKIVIYYEIIDTKEIVTTDIVLSSI